MLFRSYLGSAYSVIFWIQNFGLWLLPITIGAVLNGVNPGVAENIKQLQDNMEGLNKIELQMEDMKENTEVASVLTLMQSDLKDVPAWKVEDKRAGMVTKFEGYTQKLSEIAAVEGNEKMQPAVEAMQGHIASLKTTGNTVYNYRVPMLIFASLGVIAFFLAFFLKREDAKKHYGLELPNIKK